MSAHAQTTDHWKEVKARFRFAGQAALLLAVLGWVAWFYPYDDLVDRSGTPLGGDYVMLYVAGQTVASGQAISLYNDHQNQQRSAALFPKMDPLESWPYRYPPTVAACMAPLAKLPFAASFAVFLVLQLLLIAIVLYFLRANCRALRLHLDWGWAVLGCPVVLETIIGGQSSLLALSSALGCGYYLRRGQDARAGVWLALALYKPNVLALFVLACLSVRPRLLRGFVPTAMIGLGIALLTVGWSGVMDYLSLGTQLASSAWSLETPYWKVHGLAPYYQMLSAEHGKLLCFASGIILSVTVAAFWRSQRWGEATSLAVLLCINCLFNPYVPIYDLVLLLAAGAFAAEAVMRGEMRALSPQAFQWAAGLLFVGPHLSQLLAQQIEFQLFPWCLLAGMLAWVSGEKRAASSERKLTSPVKASLTS